MTSSTAAPVDEWEIGPIDHVDLITVKLPFVTPFGTSVHVWTHKEVLLLRLQAGGITAWGECVADPDPFYLSETTRTAAHIIREFLLPCVGPSASLAGIGRLFRAIRGHTMAKATVENALLCLLAERAGMPLHAMLGLPPRKIMSGISIGLKDSPGELLAAVEEAVARGYHRVKMKIKKGKDVEWVAAVRRRFPDLRLMVDANCDFGIDDLERLLPLDGMNLMMIEQPLAFDDIYRHAAWQKAFRTPICLDESIMGLEDAATAADLGACRIINIKQGRVGGILESLRIARYCAGRGIPVWSGGMDETGIGRALNIHLQAAPEFTLPGDTSETSRYFREDIVEPSVVLDADGFIAIPPGPGLGVRVLADRVMAYAIAWERVI
jgi:O-succinylbenzoate synthase